MTIQRIQERELTARGISCTAVVTLELNGLRYDWLASYGKAMQDRARACCQALSESGRAALVVSHDHGNLTIWQGPAGSAEPLQQPEAPQAIAATAPAAAAPPEPEPQTNAEPQTITIKYRGRTIVKPVGPSIPHPQLRRGQLSYRGRKY